MKVVGRVGDLQHLGDHSGTSNFDKYDVVKANPVEGVEEGKPSLNLVRFDHALENVTDGEGLSLTGKVVGYCQNGTQVIRWVTPFCRKETIVEVQPTNHGTDVERATDGVQLVVGSRDLRAY